MLILWIYVIWMGTKKDELFSLNKYRVKILFVSMMVLGILNIVCGIKSFLQFDAQNKVFNAYTSWIQFTSFAYLMVIYFMQILRKNLQEKEMLFQMLSERNFRKLKKFDKKMQLDLKVAKSYAQQRTMTMVEKTSTLKSQSTHKPKKSINQVNQDWNEAFKTEIPKSNQINRSEVLSNDLKDKLLDSQERSKEKEVEVSESFDSQSESSSCSSSELSHSDYELEKVSDKKKTMNIK